MGELRSFAGIVMKITFKEWLAYRASMMVSIITGPLSFIVKYVIWHAIYAASGQALLAGYTLEQIITYYAIELITFFLIWDHTDEMISEDVRTGQMLTNLIKPMSLWKFFISYKLGHRLLAALLEVLPVIGILLLITGPKTFITSSLLWYALSLPIAFFIYFILRFMIGMLAFWMTNTHGVRHIYRMFTRLVTGSLIPLTFFPLWAEKVLFFLPFQYIAYVPAQAFIGEYQLAGISVHPATILALGVMHCMFLASVSTLIWRAAIKRFHGVGT